MSIEPATKKKAAAIKLTQEDEAEIRRIGTDAFIEVEESPTGIHLVTSKDGAPSNESRGSAPGNISGTP